ncbi:MAG: putative glycoside hydrolase [Bacilli bacterium]|nr:putative glycoside hydrolase [Bacilli bacterium]MDD4283064.1 putative glycoside hydrolase [Bacilli bacterium]MDD4718487.1 putative glycoside hydrolase [Bacilli bacterium]
MTKKVNKKVIYIVLSALVLISSLFIFKNLNNSSITSKSNELYVASNLEVVKLYNQDFKDVGTIPRGTKIKTNSQEMIDEEKNVKYYKINYDNEIFLIPKSSLVSKLEETVLEEKLYVRTPVTVYANDKDSKILSMIKKGEEVEVLGFDKLDSEGKVNKYKIKYGDITGYVYGKYLVNTLEKALMNYDQKGNYQKHLRRVDTQGGGSAGNLDFYPREKPKFEDNVMPEEVRALYLNSGVLRNLDEYIKLAKESNINAFVVDIKDNTSPGYASPVMEKYSPTNFKRANNSFDNYQKAIKKLKDEGFYVIGRITVFKDSYFVNDHPESAIVDKKTREPFNHNGSFWPSAYNRLVWEFNVELAKEAVTEMGFDEIQFDYVRFPDRTYKLEQAGTIDMKNIYNEEKAQAIQGFLMYATDEIHQLGAYVSADVFGEAAHPYVTGYGQYWGAISNVVDVISAMPYPDHFNANEYGFTEIVWTVPYKLLNFWGKNYVAIRQLEIPTPAIPRTWIQAYDAIRAPRIEYNVPEIEAQIRGLYDAGLTGGYMTWNAGSSLSKYKEIAPAFKKSY